MAIMFLGKKAKEWTKKQTGKLKPKTFNHWGLCVWRSPIERLGEKMYFRDYLKFQKAPCNRMDLFFVFVGRLHSFQNRRVDSRGFSPRLLHNYFQFSAQSSFDNFGQGSQFDIGAVVFNPGNIRPRRSAY